MPRVLLLSIERSRHIYLIIAAFFVLLSPALPASAEEVALSIETLAEASDEIVIGSVTDARGDWEGRLVVTRATVRVDESLKGAPGGGIEVRQYGGTAVHPILGVPVTMTSSEVTVLEAGQRVLLFVDRDARGRRQIAGGSQGRFVIREEPVVRTATVPAAPRTLKLYRELGSRRIEHEVATLDELRARILRHVRRARPGPAAP